MRRRSDRRKIQWPEEVRIPEKTKKKFSIATGENAFYGGAVLAQQDILPSRPSYIRTIKEPDDLRRIRNGIRHRNTASNIVKRRELMNQVEISPNSQDQLENSKLIQDEDDVSWAMMVLTSDCIRKLRSYFQTRPEGIDMSQFVAIMFQFIPSSAQDASQLDISKRLCTLFRRIDVNSTGVMKWDDFVTHSLDVSRDRDLTEVSTTAVAQYKLSESQPFHLNNAAAIDQMFSFKEIDSIMMCETTRNSFSIFDASTRTFVKEYSGPGGNIIDATCLPALGYIGTVSNELAMSFWDTVYFEKRQQLPISKIHTALAWSEMYRTLYSASIDGEIVTWDVEKSSRKQCIFPKSTATFTKLQCIDQMTILAGASMDGMIHLIDTFTEQTIRSLKGHRKGVIFLDYSNNNRFLVSGGIDHTVRLWNPFFASSIGVLKGHRHQLAGIEAVYNKPEVISTDVLGTVKIWDIRMFECIQTIQYEEYASTIGHQNSKKVQIACTGYLDKSSSVLLGHGGITMFDSLAHESAVRTDQDRILHVLFCETSLIIISVCRVNIKIWDAKSGNLLRVVPGPKQDDITAICLMGTSMFIIGTNDGKLISSYLRNGDHAREAKAHTAAVTDIHFVSQDLRIFTSSLDGFLVIYNSETLAVIFRISHWNASNKDRSVYDAARHFQETTFLTETTVEIDSVLQDRHYSLPTSLRSRYGKNAIARLTYLFSRHEKPGEIGFVSIEELPKMIAELLDGSGRDPTARDAILKFTAQVKTAVGNRISFVDFLTLVYDTWHGTGLNATEIVCACVSIQDHAIVTGGSDNSICIIDYRTGFLVASCIGHEYAITALCFLAPHPIVVAADAGGSLRLWMSQANIHRNRCAVQLYNQVVKDDSSFKYDNALVSVTALAWIRTDDTQVFVTGDMQGYLKFWDPSLVVELKNEQLVPITKEWKAHDEYVCDIRVAKQLCSRNTILLSCSHDGQVKAWTSDAELVGCLGSSDVNVPWDLHVDATVILAQETNEAQHALQNLPPSRKSRHRDAKYQRRYRTMFTSKPSHGQGRPSKTTPPVQHVEKKQLFDEDEKKSLSTNASKLASRLSNVLADLTD